MLPNPLFPSSTRVPNGRQMGGDSEDDSDPSPEEQDAFQQQPAVQKPRRQTLAPPSFLTSTMSPDSPYAAEAQALDKQDAVQRFQQDYAAFQQQKAQKAQQDAALEQSYQNESRPYFRDATGAITPKHTDDQWAEERRRKVLSDQIDATRAETENPAAKPLPQHQRERLEKDLKKTEADARMGVQGVLDSQSKATTGGLLGFGATPTPQAVLAKQQLDTWTDNPDRDLGDEDLNVLAGSSDPTHQKIVSDLQAKREALKADDERAVALQKKQQDAWELRMRRDNPYQWAQEKRKTIETLPPDQLAAHIDQSAKAIQDREATIEQRTAGLQAQHNAFLAEQQQVAQENAAAIARGVPASSLVTAHDGSTWTTTHMQKAMEIGHRYNAWHAQTIGERDQINTAAYMLQQDKELHDHAVQTLQGHAAAAEEKQQLDAAKAVKDEAYSKAALDIYSLDKEQHSFARALKNNDDLDGDTAEWRKEENQKEIDKLLAKHGVTADEIKPYVEDAKKLDFDTSGAKAAVLSTGKLAVNPSLWFDENGYKKAVDKSDATPEAKAAALEMQPVLQKQVAQTLYDTVAKHPDLKAQIDALPGNDGAEKFTAYAKAANKDNWNWLRQFGTKLTAGADQTMVDLIGLHDFFMGGKSEEALKYWQERGAAAQSLTGVLPTNTAASVASGIVGSVPSMLPAMALGTAAGGLTKALGGGEKLAAFAGAQTNAATFGAQSLGGTYVLADGEYRKQLQPEVEAGRLKPEDADKEAQAKAVAPAIANGLITTTIFSRLGEKGLGAIFKSPVATENVLKQAINEKLKDYGYHAGIEALKLGTQTLAEGIVAKASFEPDKKPGDILAEALESAGTGVIFGLYGAWQHRSAQAKYHVERSAAIEEAAKKELDAYAPTGEDAATIEADKGVANALKDVGQGNIAKLTDQQLQQLGVERDASGTLANIKGVADPRVKIENGNPIITQETLDRLEERFPVIRSTISLDEAGAREQFTKQAESKKAPAKVIRQTTDAESVAKAKPAESTPNTEAAKPGEVSRLEPGKPAAATTDSTYHRALKPAEIKQRDLMATYMTDRNVPASVADTFAEHSVRAHSTSDDYRLQANEAMQDIQKLGGGKPDVGSFAERAERALKETIALKYGEAPKETAGGKTMDVPPTTEAKNTAPEGNATVAEAYDRDHGRVLWEADAHTVTDNPQWRAAEESALKSAGTDPKAQQAAKKNIEALKSALAQFAPLFKGKKSVVLRTESRSGGSFITMDSKGRNPVLNIDLERFVANHKFSRSGRAGRAAMMEEVVHAVALQKFTHAEMAGFWRTLTPEMQQHLWKSYFATDIAAGRLPDAVPADMSAAQQADLAHEWLARYILQKEFRISAAEAIGTNPGLLNSLREFLRRAFSELKKMVHGAPPDVKMAINVHAATIKRALDEIEAMGRKPKATGKEKAAVEEDNLDMSPPKEPEVQARNRVTQKAVDEEVERRMADVEQHGLLKHLQGLSMALPSKEERASSGEWNWLRDIEPKPGDSYQNPLWRWLTADRVAGRKGGPLLTKDGAPMQDAINDLNGRRSGTDENGQAQEPITQQNFGEELMKAWDQRHSLREQMAADVRNELAGEAEADGRTKKEVKQDMAFNKEAFRNPDEAGNKTSVQPKVLEVGDNVTVSGEELKVIGKTTNDAGEIELELEDHSKFGVQTVDGEMPMWVQKVEEGKAPRRFPLHAARKAIEDRDTMTLSGFDTPFNLLREDAKTAPAAKPPEAPTSAAAVPPMDARASLDKLKAHTLGAGEVPPLKPDKAIYVGKKAEEAFATANRLREALNKVIADHAAQPELTADKAKESYEGLKNAYSKNLETLAKLEGQQLALFAADKRGPEERQPDLFASLMPTQPTTKLDLWKWAGDATAKPADLPGLETTGLELFDPNASKRYTDSSHDLLSRTRLESDRRPAASGERSSEGQLSLEPRATGEAGRPLDESGDGSRDTASSGPLSADVPAAPHRESGDSRLREPAPEPEGSPAGDAGRGRGERADDPRLSPVTREPGDPHTDLVGAPVSGGTLAPVSSGRDERAVKAPESPVSEAPTVKKSPLTPEQHGDVAFVERRLLEKGKPGVLITNGTGTGKTFSGLGVVKSALDRGAQHVLIIAPSDKVCGDWKATAAEHFGIDDAHQLEGITDNGVGKRLAITTYANLGQNPSLVQRPWDVVVTDEAHYLSQSQQEKGTNALDAFRALTWHKGGIYTRAEMMHPEDVAKRAELLAIDYRARTDAQQAEIDRVNDKVAATREKLQAEQAAMGEAKRPKAVMLSATPFAYHFSLDYAEGYLFDHGPEPESRGYNTPSARDRFYVENFGYRMRTGKLTTPDAAAATATGILERRFAEKLMKDGAMSGRALEVPQDYSRQFVLSESALGAKIDTILKTIQENPRFSPLSEFIGIGDYLARRYLLEGLKAREAVARIKQHLDMGRKVVVFHDFKKGGAVNPLNVLFNDGATKTVYNTETNRYENINLAERFAELKQSLPEYGQAQKELNGLLSPIDLFQREFPQAGIFNGDVSKGNRRKIVDQFNTSGGPMNVILVQRASGKEGISLHDRDGKHQRVFMDLGIPGRPTDAIQCEGRIYRHGVKSNAALEYLTTGTSFERWTFAQTIAQRASTAENLAMGERARSLLQSFATGYNDAEAGAPHAGQGVGGKEMDHAREQGDPFTNAVALYYTNQKKTSRNKSAEGTDYFATPEPVGFKMTEWADIRPGEKVLEPSAGHGAIARFFPDSTNRHAVEPSRELASRLALNATDTTIHQTQFEDYHIGNKFDVVVMNPPFGTAGKTAMEHLIKATGHIREGGRVVALIPLGSSMEKRFDQWYESPEANGFHLRAEIKLPGSTFERAGTGVMTRVVVLDKVTPEKDGFVPHMESSRRDLSSAENVTEFFDELHHVTVPPRPEITGSRAAEPAAEVEAQPAPDAGAIPRPESTLPTPDTDSTWSPAEFKHSKTGAPVFAVKIQRRLSPEEFNTARQSAKALGGYYSSYKSDGAIPGFLFKSAEARDLFIGTKDTTGQTLHSASKLDDGQDRPAVLESPDAAASTPKPTLRARDAISGASSHITGSHVTREQGQAISDGHAQRLRGTLRERQKGGQDAGTVPSHRGLTLVVPDLTREQWGKLQALPKVGEGVESDVHADHAAGVVYKVLQDSHGQPHLGIYPQLLTTPTGKLDWKFMPATNPRQLAVRAAIIHLMGGTPTEIHSVSPDGHVILKQPLSPRAEITGGMAEARRKSALVPLPESVVHEQNAPQAYVASVEGRPYLVADLHRDNYVTDHQGDARVNDPIIAQIPPELVARVPGLQAVINEATAQAEAAGDRSARLFAADKGADAEPTSELDTAAHEAATSPLNDHPEPTQAQKEAGNYKLGHTRVSGLDISIESPAGSTRSGKDRTGKPWSVEMQSHYGYIKGTTGKDGDHVDVFVAKGTPTDYEGPVFVVNQKDPGTGRFDEHKAIIGARHPGEASQLYHANYAKGWKGMDSITTFPSMDAFKGWLEHGNTKVKAVYDPKMTITDVNPSQNIDKQKFHVEQTDGLHAATKANDEAYLKAAESGDTETAQRMVDEAAKKAGYDVGPVFHGSRPEFGEFFVFEPPYEANARLYAKEGAPKWMVEENDKLRAKGPMFWFATDEDSAASYADGGDVRRFFLNGSIGEFEDRADAIASLQRGEFTLVQHPDTTATGRIGVTSIVARAANQIKSADPITRDASGKIIPLSERFNPQSDSILYSATKTDEAYLKAAESGDLETAQRMVDEAAKKAGLKPGKVLHSTNADFSVFGRERRFSTPKGIRVETTPIKDAGNGQIYVTEDRNYSSLFGDRALTLYHRISNPADFRELGDGPVSNDAFDAHLKSLGVDAAPSVGKDRPVFERLNKGNLKQPIRQAGFDGFLLKEQSGNLSAEALAGFDTNQFKSADPITRDASGKIILLSERFNPQSDSILHSATKTDNTLENIGWNHLDKAASATMTKAFTAARESEAGQSVERFIENTYNHTPPGQIVKKAVEFVKGQLMPNAVLPREVRALLTEMQIKQSFAAETALDLTRALSGKAKFADIGYPAGFAENPAMKRQLWQAMQGEIPMDSIAPELQAVAAKLRKLLVETGKEGVRAGRLGMDTFEHLQSTYLPHYFEQEENSSTVGGIFRKFKLGLQDVNAQRTTAWHVVDTQSKDPKTGLSRLVTWDDKGKKWRFNSQEHRDAFYRDFVRKQAVDMLNNQGREVTNLLAALDTTDKQAVRAELRTLTREQLEKPEELLPATRGVIKRAIELQKSRYAPEKPLSLTEKEDAGLIADPVYAVARYVAQMKHDNATAELFNAVAAHPEWTSDAPLADFVQIPDNARFGRLAGKHVEKHIADQVMELAQAPDTAVKIYDALLGWWKSGHTVFNPGTHVRNVLGNLVFTQMAGVSPWNPGNWKHYADGLRALREGGEPLKQMFENGVLGADFSRAELKSAIRGVLPDPKLIEEGNPSLLLGIGKSVARAWDKGASKVHELYGLEDDVFKAGAFMKAQAMGMTPAEAAAHVRKWFPYYDQIGTSSTLRGLKRTVMPFMSFYRESLRILATAAKERPLALATGLALPSLLTKLAASALGLDDDDLKQIQKDMRGKGKFFLQDTPLFSMLLPVKSASGQYQMFDLSNVLPFADHLGRKMEDNDPSPAWQYLAKAALTGGPILNTIYSMATGKDSFGNRNIWEADMSDAEKAVAAGKQVANIWAPSIAPGGSAFNTVAAAGERSTNKTLEKRDPTQSVLRGVFGLDVRNANPNLYRMADEFRAANKMPKDAAFEGGSTGVQRARQIIFAEIAQDQPDHAKIARQLSYLRDQGHDIKGDQDINRLLFYRNPTMVIKGPENQQKFQGSLRGVGRTQMQETQREFAKIQQKAPGVIAQSRRLMTLPMPKG